MHELFGAPVRMSLAALAVAALAIGCAGSDSEATGGGGGGAGVDEPSGQGGGAGGGPEVTDAAAPDPIAERIDRLFGSEPPFGSLDRALIRRMMEVEPDGPFFMVNFVAHRDRAEYPDGRATELTGKEADDLYGRGVLPILVDIGARPVFAATVENTLQSGDGRQWDQVAVVDYPSRAAFFEMLEREDYQEIVVHKAAGVEATLVMPSERTGMAFADDFYQVDLAATPYPPTATDTPLAIVHLYAFRELAVYADGRPTELTGEEAVNLYTSNRADQGVLDLGVRPSLWLRPEGSLVSDGREFDEFRINLFPSHAAFAEVAGTYGQVGGEHREAGLADVYSLMTLPLINEYGYR